MVVSHTLVVRRSDPLALHGKFEFGFTHAVVKARAKGANNTVTSQSWCVRSWSLSSPPGRGSPLKARGNSDSPGGCCWPSKESFHHDFRRRWRSQREIRLSGWWWPGISSRGRMGASSGHRYQAVDHGSPSSFLYNVAQSGVVIDATWTSR